MAQNDSKIIANQMYTRSSNAANIFQMQIGRLTPNRIRAHSLRLMVSEFIHTINIYIYVKPLTRVAKTVAHDVRDCTHTHQPRAEIHNSGYTQITDAVHIPGRI